jgi:hypothetical protein
MRAANVATIFGAPFARLSFTEAMIKPSTNHTEILLRPRQRGKSGKTVGRPDYESYRGAHIVTPIEDNRDT